MKFTLLFSVCLGILSVSSTGLIAQQPISVIRGQVRDAVTLKALPDANIRLLPVDKVVSSNQDGIFRIDSLPVGRYQLQVSFIGYGTTELEELLLESGKEFVLDVRLHEKPSTLKEIEVVAADQNPQIQTIPGAVRTITIEQVNRYAATYFDPARLVTTYPGVLNTQDGTNNISIRGNAPGTMQWWLEGVEIVNPNHLTNAGTFTDRPTQSGGGVNILSAQMLAATRFWTGGTPAGYGNALSGIMDMSLRKGNDENYEFTAQAGLIGLDAAAEGPISKKNHSSFLINYRYSTIGLLSAIGLKISDEDITFQDLAANVYLPAGKAGVFTLFGIYGKSSNVFKGSIDTVEWESEKGGRNINYYNDMFAAGFTHELSFGDKWNWRTSGAFSGLETKRDQYSVFTPEIQQTYDYLKNQKWSLNSRLIYKINHNNQLQLGVLLNREYINSQNLQPGAGYYPIDGTAWMIQPNFQGKFQIGTKFSLQAGLHFILPQDNKVRIEPRLSMQFRTSDLSKLYLVAGTYTQQFLNTRFIVTQNGTHPFLKDPLPQSNQATLGFEKRFNNLIRVYVEAFYQQHQHATISPSQGSFYLFNLEENLINVPLENTGASNHYGAEIGLEKWITGNYYFIVNGSWYNALYKGSDNIERHTRFDGNVLANLTGGKEWHWLKTKKSVILGFNARASYAGGLRDTPIDISASEAAGYTIFDVSKQNEIRLADYFRIDFRIYWKRSHARYNSTLALDLQNASNQQNESGAYYDTYLKKVVKRYQLGLIPLLSYRVDF